MASHLDAFIDTNKYYFPEGVAKIREQAQPWLEVPEERDEQGTPGLQPVSSEQKYASQHVQGLYADFPTPYLAASATRAAYLAASSSSQSVPGLAVDSQNQWSSQTSIEQRQWSQVAAASTEQPQNWVQPASASQYQWPTQPAGIYLGQYPEQNHLAPPSKSHGSPTFGSPYAPGRHSHTSLSATSQISDGYSSPGSYPRGSRTNESAIYINGAEGNPSKEVGRLSATAKTARSRRTPRKRQVWWIVGGITLGLLVIVGAVVGGVLGSKMATHANSSNSTSVVPTSGNNHTSTADSLTSIRANSKMAVTGYRGANGNYTLRLFFQGPDNRIRFMDKTSMDSKWTDPVALIHLPFEPMENGPIAAGSYLDTDPYLLEFFYVDNSSTIRGQKFNLQTPGPAKQGSQSSINDYPLKVADNSSISCYFPYLVSQDDDNQLRWTYMPGKNASNASAPYWVNDTDLNIAGTTRTALTLLPVKQQFQYNFGFVYQGTDGKLATAMKDYSGNATLGASWATGSPSSTGADVPAGAALGAFAVGRPYTKADVDTFVLYQDAAGTLQVVWQNGTDWGGPQTFAALADAANGTDIACLTQASWAETQVSREQNMNRCFFQERDTRRVKEVWYDGSNWQDEGYVPMD